MVACEYNADSSEDRDEAGHFESLRTLVNHDQVKVTILHMAQKDMVRGARVRTADDLSLVEDLSHREALLLLDLNLDGLDLGLEAAALL